MALLRSLRDRAKEAGASLGLRVSEKHAWGRYGSLLVRFSGSGFTDMPPAQVFFLVRLPVGTDPVAVEKALKDKVRMKAVGLNKNLAFVVEGTSAAYAMLPALLSPTPEKILATFHAFTAQFAHLLPPFPETCERCGRSPANLVLAVANDLPTYRCDQEPLDIRV